jgi:hypothetical protein
MPSCRRASAKSAPSVFFIRLSRKLHHSRTFW